MKPIFMNWKIALIFLVMVKAGFTNKIYSASCCGGGSSQSLVLPKFATFLFDTSIEHEKYNGYWNSQGLYRTDPAGSDLRQLRMNIGAAYRLHDNIQTFSSIPYVINMNKYTGVHSNTYGAGDISAGVHFEAFNDIRCVYRVLTFEDIIPATYITAKVTVPTGISPYDNVPNSFDITGLGFYTFNFGLLLDKTIKSFNLSLSGNYSISPERPVNMEYGRYIQPYRVQQGGKVNIAISTGYTFAFESMDSITVTLGYSYLNESHWKINSIDNVLTGFEKNALSVGLALASADQNEVLKLINSFNLPLDGWGNNKPVTFITTLEFSHVIR